MAEHVFARLEHAIEIEEEYRFKSTIAGTSSTRPQTDDAGNPQFKGTLRVSTLLCRTFSDQSQQKAPADLKTSLDRRNGEQQATIGFLMLHRPHTDEHAPLGRLPADLRLQHNVAEIKVPLNQLEEKRDNTEWAVRELPYAIGEFPPGALHVQVLARLSEDVDAPHKSDYDIRYFEAFRPDQQLELTVSIERSPHPWVMAGKASQRANDQRSEWTPIPSNQEWSVAELALYWPYSQIWALDLNDSDWGYDPENESHQQILWAGAWNPQKNRRTKTMQRVAGSAAWEVRPRLRFAQPSRLTDFGLVRGRAILTPIGNNSRSIAGLACRSLDATGLEVADPPMVKYRACVVVDFEIDLAAVFSKRVFHIERHLTFDGTLPNTKNFNTIKSDLQDVAIRVEHALFSIGHGIEQQLPNDDTIRNLPDGVPLKVLLTCSIKLAGAACNSIRVLIVGEQKTVSTRTSLPGGGHQDAPGKAGRMTLTIVGQHYDHKSLNQLFNKLEKQLRQHLDPQHH